MQSNLERGYAEFRRIGWKNLRWIAMGLIFGYAIVIAETAAGLMPSHITWPAALLMPSALLGPFGSVAVIPFLLPHRPLLALWISLGTFFISLGALLGLVAMTAADV